MKSFCFGVLAGCLLSLFLPIVPPFFTVFLLLAAFFMLLWRRCAFLAGIAAFLISWGWQYHSYLQSQQLLFSQQAPVTGFIVGTVQQYAEYSQFKFQLAKGAGQGYQLNLNWSYPPQALKSGQYWQLSARLRPVTGVANPGGPNREAMALVSAVLAQGSVTDASEPRLLGEYSGLRQRIFARVTEATQELSSAPLLLALTLGERHFTDQLWLGLQQSGLAHLVAISGLHIGLVFGWGLLIFRLLPLPLSLLRWQRSLALLGALAVALLYAWLAGFAIPTVRAAAALALLVLSLLLRRRLSYSHYWLLLCALLLLVQPFWALSKSFWLSMLAVGVIFFLLWLQPTYASTWRQRLWVLLRFHFNLTVFMALLSLLMFGGSATLSLVSNLLFVPWCSLFAIPLLLLCLLAELIAMPGRQWLWQACDGVFSPLLWYLNWCANMPAWWAVPDLPIAVVVVLALLLSALYLQRKRWLFSLALLSALPLLLVFSRQAPWQLHLIDVGQGLAVLLQHNERGLLYDAGPRYASHSATAAQVLPYLRSQGVTQLDYLILSHDDSDHTGDWTLLKRHYPNLQVFSDIQHNEITATCQQLPRQYGMAKLTMLDTGGQHSSKNDGSCVLLIQLYQWRILLPGDIGVAVERQLLARYPTLRAEVLVLSHHGSNSSSDYAFLHQLAPIWALNSASLYNRHQHPAYPVRQRLIQLGIPLVNTAQSGAIRLTITEPMLQLEQYRAQRIPYWLQKPVGNAETLDATR